MKQFLKTHRYYYLLLYIPVFLAWFFLIEQINTPDRPYWVSYLPLDDKIPFVPCFSLIYCLWFPFLLLPGIYLLLKEPRAFTRFMWFFMIGMSFCLLVCTIFPNGQDLRPTEFASEGFCTVLVQLLYRADTNTNVLPSMHVVGSVAVFYGVLCAPSLKKPAILLPVFVLTALICLSTVLIKQHSVLDTLTGFAVCIPIWWLVNRFERGSLGKTHETV